MSPKLTLKGANLSPLADHFHNLANQADEAASATRVMRLRNLHRREARTWNEAARVVLNTTIDPIDPPSLEDVYTGRKP